MNTLIDINVMHDVMLKREPLYKLLLGILSLVKKDDVEEYASASAIRENGILDGGMCFGHN